MSWMDYIPGVGIPGVGNVSDIPGAVKNGLGDTFSPPPSRYGDHDQIQNLINQGFGRTNGAGPQLAMGPQDQFRNMQLTQAQQLQRIASGQQQGAGELAAQRQVANAQAAQQAAARMARGGNSALAYRNAANNTAGVGLQGAGLSQQAALQDQSAAQNALTGALGQGRGADISIAGQNAGNSLQQQQMNNQMYQQMLQQLMGMNATELQARIGAHQANQQLVGGLLSQAGSVGATAAMSDERVKTEITDATNDIDDMLDKVFPRAWVYKDAKHGTGRRVGVMAQDLERSKAGAEIVYETPDGKALDRDRVMSASLAGLARINQRLRALEAKR